MDFDTDEGVVHAVRGVSFDVPSGKTVAILGESGSGKTVTALAVPRLLPEEARVTGRVRLGGLPLDGLDERALERVRGARVGFVFQEPGTSLNPVQTIGAQIVEAIRLHRAASRAEARARALELLRMTDVPLPERVLTRYPHEISGGLRQRALVAIALACEPELVIADEPTSSLDVVTQAHVLDRLARLQRGEGRGLLLVLHDVQLARAFADEIVVLYAGEVVERGPAEEVLERHGDPARGHPYVQALLGCVIDHTRPRADRRVRLPTLRGAPPDPARPLAGCSFAPRCDRAEDACAAPVPLTASASGAPGHVVRCVHAGGA